MCHAARDAVQNEANQRKCPVCPAYLRKVEEIEQILSGREAIIEALQTQLKKCETNYKKLFGDYEQLRFNHSSAMQDNFSLKEINSKLEEITVHEKKSMTNENYSEGQLNPPNQRIKESPAPPLLEKVNSIEKEVQVQNQILAQLLEKIVTELKCCKGDKTNDIQHLIEEGFNQIESGDHLDSDPKFRKLQLEIEKLKALVDENQKENERMRAILEEKRSRLTKCTNISTTIESSVRNVSETMDREMTTSDPTEENSLDKLNKLQEEMAEKEKYFEYCSCQLVEQLQDMHGNNQILSDTLAVITEENKNNLDIITNLKSELNNANQECEERTNALKAQINKLENELDENKIEERKLKQSIDLSENETSELKDRLNQLIEENSKLKECKCDAENEFKTQLMTIGAENEDLRRELTEKALELTEYEEENRHFCQRMEVLTNYNNELINKIRELEEELLERNEVDQTEMGTQVSLTGVFQLQEQVTQLQEEKQCLAARCNATRIEVEEKLFQVDCLRTSVQVQLAEYDKVTEENEKLKQEIEALKIESKAETERLQGLINHSQNQVEMLLKEHDEKTAQIQNVANELDTIRKSVTADNDNYSNQIKQFEKEREELLKKVKEHEKCKKCNCEEGQEQIERLKAELIKKQCIILELEKSVDNFNETMKNFDKMAEELANENATLKSENEERDRQIRDLQAKLCEKVKELEGIREPLERSHVEREQCLNCNKQLEADNERLKSDYQAALCKNRCMETDIQKLKEELESFKKEKGQLEKTCVDNFQLQMELDALKDNHSRRESAVSGKLVDLQNAYDELKNLFDQRNLENDKLKNDLRKCAKSLEESKKSCRCLGKENEVLQKQMISVTVEIDTLKNDCESLKKNCAKKCVEIECLKETVDDQNKENRFCEKERQDLQQKIALKDKELSELSCKLDEFRRNDEQKSQELKKTKKQWESCCKQCKISREEYNNLRKEYKEIKSMLSDQIKRYKMDTCGMESPEPVEMAKGLKQQLLEKERDMIVLQQNLKDASYEIIELKDYVHKLINDNNVLKSGINNLIGNLEKKIKGPSFRSIHCNSAEDIADEILHSLTNIEAIISKSSHTCPNRCKNKNCDCMQKITSQYRDSSHGCVNRKSSEGACKSASEPLPDVEKEILSKSMSEPIKADSGTNTTDSDDCGCCLDKSNPRFEDEN